MFGPFPLFVSNPATPITDRNKVENPSIEERITRIAERLDEQEKLYDETLKMQPHSNDDYAKCTSGPKLTTL